MPIVSGLTDPLLVKLFHTGQTDKQIAERFGISVQAVSKRRMKLGLIRKPVSRKVNDYLAARWDIWAPSEGTGHHNAYSGKALKVWLRMRLGDSGLSQKQEHLAQQWERRLREQNEVLCYDPDPQRGWFYRPRTARDGQRVIDWPDGLPYPDEGFKRALDLPPQEL
ncbi:hypothetical protein OG306_33250 [Streptomyces sp. NBC_01241]|uniref:hypothetical protein n=1 Tax=Streptomyces sp. NBC_01241 TaxID=2903794 RepID=UPI00352E7BE6|nr:hypothetical protein OG306_33250 [Streptomyces sp. NBC_01241]